MDLTGKRKCDITRYKNGNVYKHLGWYARKINNKNEIKLNEETLWV